MVATIIENSDANDEVVAIDLGSNSFHLLLAKPASQGLQPITALGYKVQLGLGAKDNKLSSSAIYRALECLQAFAFYTRGKNPQYVRVVGTHALRNAKNRSLFINRAEKLLEQPIHIISGTEEAILLYQGVAAIESIVQTDNSTRLVVDIGGGSTELVLGAGKKIEYAISVPVGCVSYLRYFPDNKITEQSFNRAYQAASEHFVSIAKHFAGRWQEAIGCSGTLLAMGQVNGNSVEMTNSINLASLYRLKPVLFTFDTINNVEFAGLSESRRSVFATGLAIVLALFDSLSINSMKLSAVGLREGLAWQLLQRNTLLAPTM